MSARVAPGPDSTVTGLLVVNSNQVRSVLVHSVGASLDYFQACFGNVALEERTRVNV